MIQTPPTPPTPSAFLRHILVTSANLKLSGYAVRILEALADQPESSPHTPTSIAALLGCNVANTTQTIDRLHRRFLVRRKHSTEDRRQLLLTITPKGRETLTEILTPPTS